MLRFTSCLFATVVIHAYHIQDVAYHHIFLLVTVLSIAFHCSPKDGPLIMLRLLDKAVAHAAYLYVLTDVPYVITLQKEWLLLFPIMAAGLWYIQGLVEEKNRARLHACLHLVGIIGLHCYLEGKS